MLPHLPLMDRVLRWLFGLALGFFFAFGWGQYAFWERVHGNCDAKGYVLIRWKSFDKCVDRLTADVWHVLDTGLKVAALSCALFAALHIIRSKLKN